MSVFYELFESPGQLVFKEVIGGTNPPPPVTPVNTVLPSMTADDFRVGHKVTIDKGTFTGATSVTWVVQRNGVDIGGTTDAVTYTPVPDDVGVNSLRIKTTATNASGDTVVYSNTQTLEDALWRSPFTQNRLLKGAENRGSGSYDRQAFRWPLIVAQDCYQIKLSLCGKLQGTGGQQDNPNPFTIEKMALEDNVSTNIPVTIAGNRSITILGTDIDIQSDIILPSAFGLSKFTAGELYWIKGKVLISGTQQIPYTGRNSQHYAGSASRWYGAGGTVSDVDTYGAFNISGTGETRQLGYSPMFLCRQLLWHNNGGKPTIGTAGDSIADGDGDNTGVFTGGQFGSGFVQRATRNATLNGGYVPHFNLARSGNSSGSRGTLVNHYLQNYCDILHDQYLANDLGISGVPDGNTLPNLITTHQNFWTWARSVGIKKIIVTAGCPRVQSTDLYVTLGGQRWDDTGGSISAGKWGVGGTAVQWNYTTLPSKLANGTIDVYNEMNSIRYAAQSPYAVLSGTAGGAPLPSDGTHCTPIGAELMATDLRVAYAAAIALVA